MADSTDQRPQGNQTPTDQDGPQNIEEEGEGLLLVEVMSAEWADSHGAGTLCSVDCEDPPLDVHPAQSESPDPTPILLDEFFQAQKQDE